MQRLVPPAASVAVAQSIRVVVATPVESVARLTNTFPLALNSSPVVPDEQVTGVFPAVMEEEPPPVLVVISSACAKVQNKKASAASNHFIASLPTLNTSH